MIIKIYKHTNDSFCQGLVYHNKILYESSGLYNKSFLQKYDLSMKMLVRRFLPKNIFAEGICILNNIIYLLTLDNSYLFQFDLDFNFICKTKFILSTCWGLTTDGKNLIVSNGTNKIYFIDPMNFNIIKIIYLNTNNINALTYVNNKIYANIYGTYEILRYNILTKNVKIYNMEDLQKYEKKKLNQYSILNGITHIDKNTFIVTGKKWDNLYVIKLK